jgi:hypothetical protein
MPLTAVLKCRSIPRTFDCHGSEVALPPVPVDNAVGKIVCSRCPDISKAQAHGGHWWWRDWFEIRLSIGWKSPSLNSWTVSPAMDTEVTKSFSPF